MNKITFDSEKCIGCKICYKACFIDVIRWDDKNKMPFASVSDEGRAKIKNPDLPVEEKIINVTHTLVEDIGSGMQVPIDVIRGLALHNVEEYSNLGKVLPQVYEAFGDQPL